MIDTPRYTQYDLKNHADVRQLGADVGNAASLELAPLVANLDADGKFIFFTTYLAAFAGAMAAAGGVELSLAALDRIKEAVPLGVAANEAERADKH